MTFIEGQLQHIIVPSILAVIYWAGLLLPEIVMILFILSTAVLHKRLNDELILLCLLQFFTKVAQSFLRIPRILRVCGHRGEVAEVRSCVRRRELRGPR